MKSRFGKKENSTHYSKDEIYLDLLRVLMPSTSMLENSDAGLLVSLLNEIENYKRVHWRIVPLLYKRSRESGVFSDLNENTQRTLVDDTQVGIFRELAKEKQLIEVSETLSKHGIPMILLKGTALNNWIYERESPRLSNDLDILVKAKDWMYAKTLLLDRYNIVPSRSEGYLNNLYETSFVPKMRKVGCEVDLHYKLTYPKLFNIDENCIWERSNPHPYFNNSNIRIMSNEHNLLHIVLHSLKDMSFRKYWMIDFDLISNTGALDYCFLAKLLFDTGISRGSSKFLDEYSYINQRENLEIPVRKGNGFLLQYMVNKLDVEELQGDFKSFAYRLCQIFSQYLYFNDWKGVSSFQLDFLKAYFQSKAITGTE